MSKDFEHRTVEITIAIKNEYDEEVRKLKIVEDEEELSEIYAWEDIVWTMLTFMTFMPETIERFLSGKEYEPRIFCHDDDECNDEEYDDEDEELDCDDVDCDKVEIIEEGDDED
jgi:hypothetical protein